MNDPEIRQIINDWELEIDNDIAPAETNFLTTRVNHTLEIIAKLGSGGVPRDEIMPKNLIKPSKLFKSIISGDIDADKIDYLMRDNYYCGLPYKLDISSLRNNLIIDDGLKIKTGAMSFMESLLLSRYRLSKEIHQDRWDRFATVNIIEQLYKRLKKEKDPKKFIFDLHSTMNDYGLITYLKKLAKTEIDLVTSTRYPLSEIIKLEYEEVHPSIRACIAVLSESHNRHLLIKIIRSKLRSIFETEDIFVDIRGVKPVEFSMKLDEGGDILDDLIIRGILRESIRSFGIVVYGKNDLAQKINQISDTSLVIMANDRSINLPCNTSCMTYDKCIGVLKSPGKKLLANLVVLCYREVIFRITEENGPITDMPKAEMIKRSEKSDKCKDYKITSLDIFATVLSKVEDYIKNRNVEDCIYYPTRQELYKIIKTVCKAMGIVIDGNTVNIEAEEMSNSFHLELRKYEQMGLLTSTREMVNKYDASKNKMYYLFDRRHKLSEYGKSRLDKIRRKADDVAIFKPYIELMNRICLFMDLNILPKIAQYLSEKPKITEHPVQNSVCNPTTRTLPN